MSEKPFRTSPYIHWSAELKPAFRKRRLQIGNWLLKTTIFAAPQLSWRGFRASIDSNVFGLAAYDT
jgi:hypothetical protein